MIIIAARLTVAAVTPGSAEPASVNGQIAFTDDPLTAGSSFIRAVHIAELRTRIDVLRVRFSLGAYSYSDPTLTTGTTFIQAQHITELRAALEDAYVASGKTPPPIYSDPTLGAGTTMLVAHVAELRTAVIALENFTPPPTPTPGPPQLSLTHFLAFGDSITAGAVPDPSVPKIFRVLLLLPSGLAYPGQLEMMLKTTYPAQAQQLKVDNAGVQGEMAIDGAGRLPGVLATKNPNVLLLLEGVNDLNPNNAAGSMATALGGLRTMIRQAKARNVRVMIGTLLPERPGGYYAGNIDLIAPFNSQLVQMAAAEGALVVDLYNPFVPHVDDWLGPDGLHPNETGYQAMAQVFHGAIKAAFEVTGGSSAVTSRSAWMR